MNHPAKFSSPILDTIESILDTRLPHGATVLDPFAGVGGIHRLERWNTVGVEIEPEWASTHPDTIVGDSTRLDTLFAPESIDAIVTSPAYGNRMADNYAGDRHNTRRFTYRIALGRTLDENNGAGLQWGNAYKVLHSQVWSACVNVLKPGGLMIVNVSNHIRAGVEQRVVEWHVATLLHLGLLLDEVRPVHTRRMRYGANGDRRAADEKVLVLTRP